MAEAATLAHAAVPIANGPPILEVDDLKVHFPIQRGLLRRTVGHVKAVDGVNFRVMPGEALGLVGESGCGKTTTGRAILRIYEPTAGAVRYWKGDGEPIEVLSASKADLRRVRREIRMIFQDPHSSLNPRLPVGDIVGQPLRRHGIASGSELNDRVAALLLRVGLRPEYMRRYPHAFSGGERQRIGIARALALDPRLIICDEAVSALDVSVQAQILRLLRSLQSEFNLTYLFVGHDLAVVHYICDRIAVMYAGRLVELGPVRQVFSAPKHPYTEALLSAVPRPDPRLRHRDQRIRLTGEVANLANLPSGCTFHPRCRYATDRCRTEVPALRKVADGQEASCHYAETLALKGVG